MNDNVKQDILFLTDADNTLWDTDGVFRHAQLRLLSDVKKQIPGAVNSEEHELAFLRCYDQAIAERHHSGLKYPPDLLVRALTIGLSGATADKAATKVIAKPSSFEMIPEDQIDLIVATYSSNLKCPPKLRDGVLKGLNRLQDLNIKVVVVTESDKDKIEALIKHHSLPGITQVISAQKNVALYKRLKKTAKQGAKTVMVGDQLDRDIHFAHQAGLTTIHFQGGFNPKWNSKIPIFEADYSVSSFDVAVTIALNS